ncbi:NADPH-dependent 2,4-dienoyl-CoA reductase/sulfur reductase-like enzyme [Aquamicrobium defluvii]|nr:NADPH-dependent 2,4-dienoyl-CoA reductase/sulfur reductase-like enzyme [Aquamicrobium defluvii]
MRAAETLLRAGLSAALIDEAPLAGGQIYRQPPESLRRPARQLYGSEARKALALHESFSRLRTSIDYRPETLVWGAREKRLLLSGPAGNTELAFDKVILATGAMDRIVPVPGWTLPGVYSLGGAQVVLKGQACLIGKRPVFIGTGPLLYLVAYQYCKAGAEPAAIVDTSDFTAQIGALPRLLSQPATLLRGIWYNAALVARRVPVFRSAKPQKIEIRGRQLVVTFKRNGKSFEIGGDAVGMGWGLKPETQLAEILGCAFSFHAGSRWHLPRCDAMGRSSTEHVYIAGDASGIRGADAAEAAGELAAFAVLEDLGHTVPQTRRQRLLAHLARAERFRSGLERAFPYQVPELAGDTVLCRCENVTVEEVRAAISSWQISELNQLKALTRCGMGRCQGRLCGSAAMEVLAAETGVEISDVGSIRGQIPLKPLIGARFQRKAAP